jgi:hypothetical protein
MTDEAQGRRRKRRRPAAAGLALAMLAVILAVLLVPPLVSIRRYKSQITHLMSTSLGRPVRLSSVELRLLPRPGFVLTDLTVEEDPAYGSEPVLHADSVTASIRLLSLWRGRVEIGTISVDDASLNLVRTTAGRWNVESLFRTAAAQAAPPAGSARPRPHAPLPYLEATNSRINIKDGVEKLPYSLINADLSFWQEEPGNWRIRLRGQPARTDLNLDLADTGVVRLEASVRRAPEMRRMPVHLDLEWREAQLGQLTRLLIGSDPGWRGDLTGELHLDGVADAAHIRTRLSATNVHRAEFAPAAPMDFDANCGFIYHYSSRALEGLVCDSPLGDGRIRLMGDLPGGSSTSHFSVELDRIPVAAALDGLRTVRSGFGPGLEAKGTVSGKIVYAENVPVSPPLPTRLAKGRPGAPHTAPAGPLAGQFTVSGFELSGDGLSRPIQVAQMLLEPAASEDSAEQRQELSVTASIPAGATVPLTVTSRLSLSGYQLTTRGQASFARARELAHVAGLEKSDALSALTGEAIAVDLIATGPWLTPQGFAVNSPPPGGSAPSSGVDKLHGTLTVHNAKWKAEYLTNPVEISQATLQVGDGDLRWDPVVFSYGPVKGTAALTLPSACDGPPPCPPKFEVQFGTLDASALEAAILGAHEPGTLLSTLIARLTPASFSSAPSWPLLEGAVTADSLILGPITLQKPTATLHILQNGAEITGMDAGLLGGLVHGSGTLRAAGAAGADGKTEDKPVYTLEGKFTKLNPAAVGRLLDLRWSGGDVEGAGKIDLAGFTDKDLAASAKGTLHIEWRHGSVGALGPAAPAGPATADTSGSPADLPVTIPAALIRFDRWTADAAIANGTITLQENQVQRGARKSSVAATVTFGVPPKVSFGAPRETQTAKQ